MPATLADLIEAWKAYKQLKAIDDRARITVVPVRVDGWSVIGPMPMDFVKATIYAQLRDTMKKLGRDYVRHGDQWFRWNVALNDWYLTPDGGDDIDSSKVPIARE